MPSEEGDAELRVDEEDGEERADETRERGQQPTDAPRDELEASEGGQQPQWAQCAQRERGAQDGPLLR